MQRPTPFVILSHELPIAVAYDARSLDVREANVVDCLRKQAKTRAFKLIKEVSLSLALSLARSRSLSLSVWLLWLWLWPLSSLTSLSLPLPTSPSVCLSVCLSLSLLSPLLSPSLSHGALRVCHVH